MTTGMLMAVISFIVAGLLQLQMQKLSSFANLPSTGCSHLRIINLMPDSSISITSYQKSFPSIPELPSYNATQYYSFNINSKENITAKFLMDDSYISSNNYPSYISISSNESTIIEDLSYSFIIGLGSSNTNQTLVDYKMIKDDYVPEYEVAKIRILAVNNLNHNHSLTMFEIAEKNINLTAMIPSDYIKIPYGSHAILINGVYERVFSFKSGSIYTIVVTFENINDKLIF
ncbi:hypothetical protein HZS_4068 [Henneguya salminicola]|nr:hypothetical protein HZS_4068 [Henneguya salminicola]